MLLRELKTMSVEQVKDVMKNNPAKAAEINELLRTREAAVWVSSLLKGEVEPEAAQGETATSTESVVPTTEEIAAQATRDAEAAQLEFDRKKAEESAAAVAAKPIKLVREYQVRDDKGNPLGRPTHLEANSAEEMLDKMQAAHENAVRFAHRTKNAAFKPAPPKPGVLSEDEINAIAKEALESGDATKAVESVRRIIDQTATNRLAKVAEKEETLEQQKLEVEGKKIAYIFMQKHVHDFNPCEANSLRIGEYLDEHNMLFTLDNLEVALDDLNSENKLAPVLNQRETASATEAPNASAAAATTATPTAAITAATSESVADSAQVTAPPAVSQPAAAATATTPVAATNQPAARRPGVNGSLPPGTFSAERPTATTPLLTKKDIGRMDSEKLRHKLKTDPKFVEQFLALGFKLQ